MISNTHSTIFENYIWIQSRSQCEENSCKIPCNHTASSTSWCVAETCFSGGKTVAKSFNVTNIYKNDYSLSPNIPNLNWKYLLFLEIRDRTYTSTLTPTTGYIWSYVTNFSLSFSIHQYTCFHCLWCMCFTDHALWWSLF